MIEIIELSAFHVLILDWVSSIETTTWVIELALI